MLCLLDENIAGLDETREQHQDVNLVFILLDARIQTWRHGATFHFLSVVVSGCKWPHLSAFVTGCRTRTLLLPEHMLPSLFLE